jgi:hypothetical protein
MSHRFIVDESGSVYMHMTGMIVRDLPEPSITQGYLPIDVGKDRQIILAPDTQYIDVSSMFDLTNAPYQPYNIDISFNTDLPVVIEYYNTLYLQSTLKNADEYDSSYKFLDMFVYTENGELHLDTLDIWRDENGYDIHRLPYIQFCKDRGIKYVKRLFDTEIIPEY